MWLLSAYVAGNFAYGLVAGLVAEDGDASGQDLKVKMEEKWANIRKASATNGHETNGDKQEDGPPNYMDNKPSST